MATRTRDSTTIAKEKKTRGTSPNPHVTSNTQHTQRRTSPNPPKTNSPSRTNNDSQKNVPNYLKPTLSSGITDLSKQHGKKPVSDTTHNNKPTLVRRRSFDKPPSPSRTQKSRVSPNPTLRSSSFSGKTVHPHKGVADNNNSNKNLRGVKDGGKQHTLYARPVNSGVKKSNSSGSMKKLESGNGSSSTIKEQQVSRPKEKVEMVRESSIAEHEENTVQIESVSHDEKGDKGSLVEDQELLNVEPIEEENDDKDAEIVTVDDSPTAVDNLDAKIVAVDDSPAAVDNFDAKIVTIDGSTTNLEHHDTSLGIKLMEESAEDEPHAEEISGEKEEPKEESVDEMKNINGRESVAGDHINEEVEEKGREEEIEEEGETKSNMKEEEEAIIGSDEAHDESKEKEVEEAIVEDKLKAENEKPKAENEAPKMQVAQGKKDSAVSNDVIEETASKLREQRKNKVRALAGAFETVISLQDK